jgi:hypothetical protein
MRVIMFVCVCLLMKNKKYLVCLCMLKDLFVFHIYNYKNYLWNAIFLP